MNPEQRQVYKDKLEAVLLEIEDYLSKSEDAAEARLQKNAWMHFLKFRPA